MSRVFSSTIMISVATMFSAATNTIRPIVMNITSCSSLRA